MANDLYIASTTAPINIAVIKYWGKRSTTLNLPTNSSLSVTLSQSDLRTLTTAACSPSFTETRLWLNGEPQSVSGPRLIACISELKKLRKKLEDINLNLPKLSQYNLHIVSENNFPTAAGLASSAAGFAAFVQAIANLYELPHSATELSKIARQGSGSACRSLFGGYVSWEMGEKEDGSDSYALQVATKEHWPDICAAILVVSSAKKGVSSTTGMQATVATSTLFEHRARNLVPKMMKEMERAVKKRDFESFADLTMKDSNQLHAVCLDTTPPIFYLNDVSRNVIKIVEELNRVTGRKIAAYTFDAGPNAVIYYLKKNEGIVLGLFKNELIGVDPWTEEEHDSVIASVPDGFNEKLLGTLKDGVSKVILTRVGDGPARVEEHLIGADGLPKN